jgi:ATP-dependent DNA helicase RecG
MFTPDNNHYEVISNLRVNNIIYKHPTSPDHHPIFLVNRALIKKDFRDELIKLFGGEYVLTSDAYKKVLNAIYLHNNFSKNKYVSASLISQYLFFQENKIIKDIKDYDNFKRQIRYIFNQLENKKFIIRPFEGKPQFEINTNFTKPDLIFN